MREKNKTPKSHPYWPSHRQATPPTVVQRVTSPWSCRSVEAVVYTLQLCAPPVHRSHCKPVPLPRPAATALQVHHSCCTLHLPHDHLPTSHRATTPVSPISLTSSCSLQLITQSPFVSFVHWNNTGSEDNQNHVIFVRPLEEEIGHLHHWVRPATYEEGGLSTRYSPLLHNPTNTQSF
ncbi:hypothetical protein SESBI_06351 [Sesbania bispinosa]|nr:hypothetical protein SESBI_06351 [Sesbania bispinosa]